MNIVRDLLSSIRSDSRTTAAVAFSNATALAASDHYATYRDLLSTKRRGTPLWIPEPNAERDINYRRRGAAIGDVIVLTDDGAMDFLFNICLDADDPINGNNVPEGFFPLQPGLTSNDIRRSREYGEDSYLASQSITKRRNCMGPAGLFFQSSAPEGAILVMPEGACSQNLARVRGFDRYLAENLESWYHYVTEVREWDVKPGELRLITGVHMAKAWGIATFSNERTAATDINMSFKSNEDTAPGAEFFWEYFWEYEGIVDSTRSGPTREQREAVSERLPRFENQCLFVRTANPLSREVGGKNHEPESIAVSTSQTDTSIRSGLEHSGSAGPSNPSSSSSSQSGHGHSVPNQMDAQYSLSAGHDGFVLRDHPSKAINDFLLQEKPNARMVITHDEDWISLLTDDDVSLPSGDELVARLKKSCKITEHRGVVSLEFDVPIHLQSMALAMAPMEIGYEGAENIDIWPDLVSPNFDVPLHPSLAFASTEEAVASYGDLVLPEGFSPEFNQFGVDTIQNVTSDFTAENKDIWPDLASPDFDVQLHPSLAFASTEEAVTPFGELVLPEYFPPAFNRADVVTNIDRTGPSALMPSDFLSSDLEGQYASLNRSILDSSTREATIGKGPLKAGQKKYRNPSSFDTSASEAGEEGSSANQHRHRRSYRPRPRTLSQGSSSREE